MYIMKGNRKNWIFILECSSFEKDGFKAYVLVVLNKYILMNIKHNFEQTIYHVVQRVSMGKI